MPFFFSLQRLINMKIYDKQLYENVEDLVVWKKGHLGMDCRVAMNP